MIRLPIQYSLPTGKRSHSVMLLDIDDPYGAAAHQCPERATASPPRRECIRHGWRAGVGQEAAGRKRGCCLLRWRSGDHDRIAKVK